MDTGIRPKKSLGQHFLRSGHHVRRIVEAADVGPEDVVLEIGPGTGILTKELVARARRVIAVEIDERMVSHLRRKSRAQSNFTVVHGDILSINPGRLIESNVGSQTSYKVVANLPYYITSAIMRHLLESTPSPRVIVVTVQKEVAQRMIATPPRMNLLAVSVQFYGRPRIVLHIPRRAFHPPPKVDSAVVRIDVYEKPIVEVPCRELFFAIVRAGFSQKRKQLHNALASGLNIPPADARVLLEEVGIDPRRRAETLSLEEWARLAWAYKKRTG